MKQYFLLLVIITFFLINTTYFTPLQAQTWSINTGISMLTGERNFVDYWQPGIHFDIGIEKELLSHLNIIGSIEMDAFSIDTDKILKESGATGVTLSGGGITTLSLNGGIKAIFPSESGNLVRYVTGGLGLFNIQAKEISASGSGQTITIETNISESGFLTFFGYLPIKVGYSL